MNTVLTDSTYIEVIKAAIREYRKLEPSVNVHFDYRWSLMSTGNIIEEWEIKHDFDCTETECPKALLAWLKYQIALAVSDRKDEKQKSPSLATDNPVKFSDFNGIKFDIHKQYKDYSTIHCPTESEVSWHTVNPNDLQNKLCDQLGETVRKAFGETFI